jgi:RNA recognition motif-containing protein
VSREGWNYTSFFGLTIGEKVAFWGHHPRKSGKEQIMVNIYVGNLSYNLTEDDLRNLFEAHGQVDRASLAMDRATGRARGFGFVEMPNDAEARAAIESLNDVDLQGRKMMVNEARAKEERPARRERY